MGKEIMLAVIEVQLISLRTRRQWALGYQMNSDMQIEASLLFKQIEALEKESERLYSLMRKDHADKK